MRTRALMMVLWGVSKTKRFENVSIEEFKKDCVKEDLSEEGEYMQQNNKMHQPVTAVIYSKSRRH